MQKYMAFVSNETTDIGHFLTDPVITDVFNITWWVLFMKNSNYYCEFQPLLGMG